MAKYRDRNVGLFYNDLIITELIGYMDRYHMITIFWYKFRTVYIAVNIL